MLYINKKLQKNLHISLIFSIFVVDDKGESSYTPLSRGAGGVLM